MVVLLLVLILVPGNGPSGTTSSPAVYVFGRSGFPASNTGIAVAVGDLNGDGQLDFVAAGIGQPNVAILLGQPNGGFVEKGTIPLPAIANAGTIGDFNGDGKMDLALATSSGLLIALGNGDGTFGVLTAIPVNGFPVQVIAGDFNKDGKLDLAVTVAANNISSGAPGTVSIFLGNGDGTFQAQKDFPAGIGVRDLVAADFNKDGKLDIVVVNSPAANSSTISFLLGNGDGTFQPATSLSVAAEPTGVAVADFNGDGNLDLAVSTLGLNANGDGLVSVLLGNGDGTFKPHMDVATGAGADSIVAVDLNNDGKQDIVVDAALSFNGAISVVLGNGDGTFQAHTEYKNGGVFGRVFAGDFNHDGKVDIGLGNGLTSFFVLLGNGDGTLAGSTDVPTPTLATNVVAGDLNGDGIPDLVTINQTSLACPAPGSAASVFISKGDGTFQPPVNYATGDGPVAGGVGDFTGKGRLDLAVVNGCDNTVSVLLNNGDGTYKAKMDYPTGGGPSAIVVADLNSDGILDLAVANSADNTVSILLGNGDGTFKPKVDYGVGSIPSSIAVADFNGDGKLDLVTTDNGSVQSFTDTAKVSLLLGNGDGTFQTFSEVDLKQTLTPVSLVAGDFNGDGKPDIAVVANRNAIGAVVVLLGHGDGTFALSSPPTFSTGRLSDQVVSADFDGDGILDLAVTAFGIDRMTVLKGNGDGTFQIKGTYGATAFPTGIVAADFNGDNFPDAVFVNGGPLTFTEYVSTPPPGPDFTLSATPPSASVSSANPTSATYTVNVGSRSGFNQAVSLTCAGAPKNSTCTVSPATVNLSGGSKQTVTVSVSTVASVGVAAILNQGMSISRPALIVLAFTIPVLLLCLVWSAIQRRMPRLIPATIAVLACGVGLTLSSCGSSAAPPGPPLPIPPGTYTLTVTGMGGSSQHSVNLTFMSKR